MTFALLARRHVRAAPLAAFIGGCIVHGAGDVLTGLAGAIAVAVAAQFIRGVGGALIETNLQTLLQRSVPTEMLGRVFANVYGAVGVAAAISTAVAGPLVDATSPGTVLVISGLCAFAAAAVAPAAAREGGGRPIRRARPTP